MDRSNFAEVLQGALIAALKDFRRKRPDESPYALAIIPGQVGAYLNYAVATEEGLQRVARQYSAEGYRHEDELDEPTKLELLAAWLRWANPDDGWYYEDFSANSGIVEKLAALVQKGEFGEDADGLEEFCTDTLHSLQSSPDWQALMTTNPVVVGVTFGEDPRDFLRTATRANSYALVTKLWSEVFHGESLDRVIVAGG